MRHVALKLQEKRTEVSIHAPVKDATIYPMYAALARNVSIHAPVKDATLVGELQAMGKKVSIHAPVKDATAKKHIEGVEYAVSIHAPVKDATPCLWKALLITFSAYNFANNKVYK